MGGAGSVLPDVSVRGVSADLLEHPADRDVQHCICVSGTDPSGLAVKRDSSCPVQAGARDGHLHAPLSVLGHYRGIAVGILSPTTGIINQILMWVGLEPIYFLGEESYIRDILIGSGIWKEAGWGTIIYLAALAGINPDLYEVARVDGANRWRQTLAITIPSILPTIMILFLLNIGNFLDFGFERVFVFLNALNENKGDILDTYIYRVGLLGQQYSYTTAIGLFKSLIGSAAHCGRKRHKPQNDRKFLILGR